VVRLCVWSRKLLNEEAVAHWRGCWAKNKQTNKPTSKQLKYKCVYNFVCNINFPFSRTLDKTPRFYV